MDQQKANAHLIAQAFRTVARILASDNPLDAEAAGVIGIGAPFTVQAMTKFADRLEATAPFTPLTDEERQSVFEELVDEVSDYSRKENAENICGDWTDAEWRMEFDDREAQRLEDEAEEAGE